MPTQNATTRRRFLGQTTAALATGLFVPYYSAARAEEAGKPKSKNDRFQIGVIGIRNPDCSGEISENPTRSRYE